ncbi:Protein transport protein Sec24B [Coemansia erecta]|uniref:2'-phosphotransferase n=1 Tax=Coemansia erecta TaxID=147472 RepID=A0A9W7XZF5_9FUNG|nr:Protein transport protein Sec24B [Coemansia erecta]
MSHTPAAAQQRPPPRRRQDDSPEVKLSKFLSYVLRHGAAKEGMVLRDDGSILLSTLMKHKKLQSTAFEQVKHVVDTNEKKRFVLFREADEAGTQSWYIRATQGHSVQIKEPPLVLLTAESIPSEVIHGTTKEKLPLIREKGLSRMARTHIHFASGLYGNKGVVSGMRASANAFIYIDTEKAMRDGIEFYISENNVILSKGLGNSGVIPSKYFAKVIAKY